MINQLISGINNQNIQQYLRHKVSTFKYEYEELNNLISITGYELFSELIKLGEAEFENGDDLIVFSCKYEGELSSRTSKKKQYDLAKKVLKEDFKDGAIFIFYDKNGRFRFSFIRRNYDIELAKFTPHKRYTFFVDPLKNNKTFKRRIEACFFRSLDEIQDAFSVEPLSKQFYKDLSQWYFAALGEVKFPNDHHENEYTLHANALIRMITRIMFVWFMKQKGLVPDDLFNKEALEALINQEDINNSTYYKAILQNLFFATLNTPREKGRQFVNRQFGVQNFFRYKRFIKNVDRFQELMDQIPFLNGGLFENLDVVKPEDNIEIRIDCFSDSKRNEPRLKVPDYLFFGTRTADISDFYESGNFGKIEIKGIIDILNQYDFTIDENTPLDQEVALDPELLGLVFENLLASYNPETQNTARKKSGSFYTPRPIVDYMVEESLAYYIADNTGIETSLLKKVFSSSDDQPIEDDNQKQDIISAISHLKILDPACGSGAFPMGALQKMVHALSKLDPENVLWRQSQKERLMKETFAAFENTELENLKKEVDLIFDNQLNDPDYARKLYLIENCLYGVDIQPIAMQISKLRFFISLLVEQQIDPEKENFGIIALPNLETKFVAANSLIKLKKPISGLMGQENIYYLKNLKIEVLEKELEKVRHKYFTARTSRTKEKRRTEDHAIRTQIAHILIDDGWNTDEAIKIASWDPYNPNTKSNWFDPEWMFGVPKFDIVIGNPPYISLQRMSDSKIYQKVNYETYEKTGDLYSLFYERAIEILKNKGYLCYITSNKWINANYGKSTRKYLATKSNPLILIDFAKVKIFESATVFVNVLITQKHTNKNKLEACTIKGDSLPKQDLRDYFNQNKIILKNLDDNIWKVNNLITQTINDAIELRGIPLRDWSSINFYRGITTGYNKAFLIDALKKQELINKETNSSEVIELLLRGKDIKRWGYQFSGWYLINAHNGLKKNPTISPVDIVNKYPAVYQHLLEFENELINRQDQGNHWTNLRDCAFLLEFKKPKIVWIEISDRANYTIDNEGMYLTNSAYFTLVKS